MSEILTESGREGPTARLRWSYQEFLESYDGEPAEWVDGEVAWMSPVTRRHDLIVIFLKAILLPFIQHHRLGELHGEPFQMRAAPHLPGRSPDVLFVSSPHIERVRDKFLDGPADLVIEVISPGSRTLDRGDKYTEYEQSGVGEHWLVDPERTTVEFFRLSSFGRYELVPMDADGRVHSEAVPGLWLYPDWLLQAPPVLDVLRAWDLIS